MVQRQGKVNAYLYQIQQLKHWQSKLLNMWKRLAQLYTDEWLGYNKVVKMYQRDFANHSSREYVQGDVYTNTIEGFWAGLKRGVLGIYHSRSKKYLQNDVDEFVFRYNTQDYSRLFR